MTIPQTIDPLSPLRLLLARYEAWTGERDCRWPSSPQQRDDLRAAIAEAESLWRVS